MAAKMTISIPDDLYERVKAENDLNVSALTQKALLDELRARELVQGGNEATLLVERLASEDQDVRRRFGVSYRAGRSAAAKRLTPDDMGVISTWFEQELDGVPIKQLDREDLLNGLASRIEECLGEHSPVYTLKTEYLWDTEVGEPPRRGALVAYIAGIVDVWKQAREAL